MKLAIFIFLLYSAASYSSECEKMLADIVQGGVWDFQQFQKKVNSKKSSDQMAAIEILQKIQPADFSIYRTAAYFLLQSPDAQVRLAMIHLLTEHEIYDKGVFLLVTKHIKTEEQALVGHAMTSYMQLSHSYLRQVSQKFLADVSNTLSTHSELRASYGQLLQKMGMTTHDQHMQWIFQASKIPPESLSHNERQALQLKDEMEQIISQLRKLIQTSPIMNPLDFIELITRYNENNPSFDITSNIMQIIIHIYKTI